MARAICLKVRAKNQDGEVRFYGDEAEPIERAIESAAAGLRIHLSSHSAEIDALKLRLEGAAAPRGGGEVVLVAGLGEGREVEVKLAGRFTLDAALRGAIKTAPGVMYLEDV